MATRHAAIVPEGDKGAGLGSYDYSAFEVADYACVELAPLGAKAVTAAVSDQTLGGVKFTFGKAPRDQWVRLQQIYVTGRQTTTTKPGTIAGRPVYPTGNSQQLMRQRGVTCGESAKESSVWPLSPPSAGRPRLAPPPPAVRS